MRTDLKHLDKFPRRQEDKTVIESTHYILFRKDNVYYLRRKKDCKQVTILKDKVEDFVMWGQKEFKNECKQVKFD